MVGEENNFMDEINRQKKKGDLDDEYHGKVRKRHNAAGNRISMAIDEEVFDFLGFTSSERKFIVQTLREIEMSDFGLLEKLEANDAG